MGSPDEMADALWAAPVDDADWFRTCTLTELRTLAREAAKQALLEAAADYEANGLPVRRLLDRAEQIGKETDG